MYPRHEYRGSPEAANNNLRTAGLFKRTQNLQKANSMHIKVAHRTINILVDKNVMNTIVQ